MNGCRRDSLDNLFHTFHRMFNSCMRQEFERRGLAAAGNPAILFLLRQKPDSASVTQREIADILGISPPTVAVSVKRMERAGLLRKENSQQDLRKNYISLTEKGEKLTAACEQTRKALTSTALDGFAPEESEFLRQAYLRMIHNLHEQGCRCPSSVESDENEVNSL